MEKEIPQSPRIKSEPTWQDLVPPPRVRTLRSSLQASTAPVDAYQLVEDGYKQTLEWAPSQEPLTFIYDPYSLENIEDLRTYLANVQDLLWEWERAKGLKQSETPIKKLYKALNRNITELKELLDKQEKTLTNFNLAEGADEDAFALKLEERIPKVVEKMEEIGQQYNTFLSVDESEDQETAPVPNNTTEATPIELEDVDIVEFDLYKGMGLDSARAHVRELYFAEVITPYEKYNGVWPTAECEKLHDDIEALQYEILSDLELQEAFILGSNLQDKKQDIEEKIWEYGLKLDALTELMKQAVENSSEGASTVARGAENNAEVFDAREFENFKQRIHRRQKDIDSALKYFESHFIAPEHQHYLDNLVICRKAITDIVVAGLEEGKAQDATANKKVYSAELATRAEPYLSQINDIMYAIEDLYAPQPPATGKEGKVNEETIETATSEPRVLSGAEEMTLLQAYFSRYMNGPQGEEKRVSILRDLQEMPPEEWAEALKQARAEYTDEELEALLGAVVTPTTVSGGVAPARVSPAPFIAGAAATAAAMPGVPPQPAAPKAPEAPPADAPEKTLTPEQQATRDKWLAARKKLLYNGAAPPEGTSQETSYKDPTPEEVFEALLPERKLDLARNNLWKSTVAADGSVHWDKSNPDTFANRYDKTQTSEERSAIFNEHDAAMAALSDEEIVTLAKQELEALPPYTQFGYWLDAKTSSGEVSFNDEQVTTLLEEAAMQSRLNATGLPDYTLPTLEAQLAAATDEAERAQILQLRDKEIAYWRKNGDEYRYVRIELERKTPEARAAFFVKGSESEEATEVPLQTKYQNELTGYYDSLKTEGGGWTRFGRRLKATFGLKPELPPALDATREEMLGAAADYAKETRAMLALREETGKEVKRAFTKERKAELLRLHVMRFLTTTAGFPNMFEEYKASDAETKKTLLLEAQAQVDKLQPEERTKAMERAMEAVDTFLTSDQQAAYAVEAQEAVQQRYKKMLARSVLISTFDRERIAQEKAAEELGIKIHPALKKYKKAAVIGAVGVLGYATGGLAVGAVAVTRSLLAGAATGAVGGLIDKWGRGKVKEQTDRNTEAQLNALASKLNKDAAPTKEELNEIYQELVRISKSSDASNRNRAIGLIALAFTISAATGALLEGAAEGADLTNPDTSTAESGGSTGGSNGTGTESAEQSVRSQAEGGGVDDEASAGAVPGTEGAGDAVGGTERAAVAEAPKPYTAERGDNMWDILEGQTDAEKLPFMDQVDQDKLQGLLKEVELKLDGDEALRAEIGFGDSAHDLGVGDTVNLERLNEEVLEIAKEKGMLVDEDVAGAADASAEATSTDSVETPAANPSPEQPASPTIEAAAEAATVKAEAAADSSVANSTSEALAAERKPISFPHEADQIPVDRESIPGKTIDTPHIGNDPSKVGGPIFDGQPYYEGASYDGLKGAEKVNAYAASYVGGPFDRGPLAFEKQLVKPYIGSIEGTPDKGFFGLFKAPPPPSMGGYALFQHVPLKELAEVNALPDDTLLPTLAEKYHVEKPEQFSVWVEKLNDMQGREIFNLDQTPELTLADAVALDVINSKTTSV